MPRTAVYNLRDLITNPLLKEDGLGRERWQEKASDCSREQKFPSGWSERVLATGPRPFLQLVFGFHGGKRILRCLQDQQATLLSRGEDLIPETSTKEEKLSYNNPL